ncbi:MAG: hypothetical protein ACREJU_12350 [Nitrospiraceae bacterium]
MSWEEWGIVIAVGALLIGVFVSFEMLFPARTSKVTKITKTADAPIDEPSAEADFKHVA